MPVIIQAVLSSSIPSSSSLVTELFDKVFGRKYIPNVDLNIDSFGTQIFNYKITGSKSETVDSLFKEFNINRKFRNKINFNLIQNEKLSVDDYVFYKRTNETKNLIKDYFFGIEIDSDNINSILGLHSTLAFHSSATILNEMNSFLYAYYSNNMKKSIRSYNSPISVGKDTSLPSDVKLDTLEVLSCIEIMPFSFLDYINAIIIAFIISISTIHLTKEKRNGSKSLQLLSGTHYAVYWLSNFIFDFIVFFIQISTMILALKIVSSKINDSANDTFLIAHNGLTLFNLYLFMLLTCFSWSILSAIWSNFFKSDIVGFVVLFIILSFASLIDMICVLLKFFDATTGENGTLGTITNSIRGILTILFPNIAVKRALFNLKLQNLPVCLMQLNLIFNCKLF